MDAQTFLQRPLAAALAISLCLGSGALVMGCDEPKAQAAGQESQPKSDAVAPADPAGKADAASNAQTSPEAAVSPETAATGKSEYVEEAFSLHLTRKDPVKSGELTTLSLVLEAKSGYKVNDEYPIKFTFATTDRVKPEKATVTKDDAKVEKMRAELPLKVTVERAGKAQVAGKLSFSVCTEERCLIEKRDLLLEIDAS